jgi:UDP-glucose 4-epimerase
LRFFNAAGADPDGELGEAHSPETHLIPRVIEAAMDSVDSVEIYGVDYPTEDGTAVRDYVHVSDLAAAHVAALEHLLSGGESCAANLGTGRGSSVREVLSTVEQVSGVSIRVKQAPRRPGDPPVLVADTTKAQTLLGWRPRNSSLTNIICTAWQWQQRAIHVSSR